jgi:hypothetical protein
MLATELLPQRPKSKNQIASSLDPPLSAGGTKLVAVKEYEDASDEARAGRERRVERFTF